jgi:hypothetical protein
MKKSEIYHLAQLAVMTNPSIYTEQKLDILRVLMDDEDLEKYREEKAEKEKAVDTE